jgi:hypothetical protein
MVAGKGAAVSSSYITIATLKLDAPAPKLVSPSGSTLFNITGRGFDSAACEKNQVDVDGVQCTVLSCSSGALTVLYPGELRPWRGGGGWSATPAVTSRRHGGRAQRWALCWLMCWPRQTFWGAAAELVARRCCRAAGPHRHLAWC